jgi:hypothetical protein
MRGAIPPLPQYVLMAWCLVSTRRGRDKFCEGVGVCVSQYFVTMLGAKDDLFRLERSYRLVVPPFSVVVLVVFFPQVG